MIETISINNYALIDRLNIDLSEGLNVITGETGAGKSIVIDALSLLLGSRANRNAIRGDQKKMTVSAQIRIDDAELLEELLENGIEPEDGVFIFSREVDRSGKNVCRINSKIVPVSLFKKLGPQIVDVYSQHENIWLFKPENQRALLDSYGGPKLLEIVSTLKKETQALKEAAGRIKELQADSKESARKTAMERFQLEEITKAELRNGEEEELTERLKELEKNASIYDESNHIYYLLSEEEAGIGSYLSQLNQGLSELKKIDPFFGPYLQRIQSIESDLNDLSFAVSSYIDKIEYDPGGITQINNRLNEIDELKKKYGDTVQEILDYAAELEKSLERLDNVDELLENEKKNYLEARKHYNELAHELTDLRKETAGRLKTDLERELKDLAMDKASFIVDLTTDEELISASGQDKIEYLLSVNPGSKPDKLRKIASGGEISRIMLAVKGIFGERDKIGTMIFDEIDTGISGRTAQVVAEKIANLSKNHQLICITHLPQIAAMADRQFLVEKASDEESTSVSFGELEEGQRVDELARMLGGKEVTQTTKDNAKELIAQAQNYKKDLSS